MAVPIDPLYYRGYYDLGYYGSGYYGGYPAYDYNSLRYYVR